jgi:hypothetical protein
MLYISSGISPEKPLYERSSDVKKGTCRDISEGIGPVKLLLDRSNPVILVQFLRP